jgi:hypothetical protein
LEQTNREYEKQSNHAATDASPSHLNPARFSVGRRQVLVNATPLLSALKFPMTKARRGSRWE